MDVCCLVPTRHSPFSPNRQTAYVASVKSSNAAKRQCRNASGENYSFRTEKIDYFGQFIRAGTLKTRTKATLAPRNWTTQPVRWNFGAFYGLYDAFRRFKPNFSRVANPPNKKICREEPTKFPKVSLLDHNTIEQLESLLKIRWCSLTSVHIVNQPSTLTHTTLK